MIATKETDGDIESLKVEAGSTQMTLFEIIEPHASSKQDEYSNTIEIYDALPKYVWGGSREFDDLSKALVTRESTIRGVTYSVKIRPALIEKEDTTVLIYPGQREELVEDALRKIAVNGDGYLIEGKAGVMFTLYQLQQELASTGHGFNLNEIKEAILVCRGATLECHSANGDTFVSASFFPMIGLTTRDGFFSEKGDARCYVQFNPLVSESIKNLSFRQYSYKMGMEIRSPLARYVYKRMCHYWTQAATDAPYTPSLVSFLSQSPRGLSERMSENIRAMKNTLEMLVKHGVVSDYDEDRITKGRRVLDIRYKIRPTERFVKQARSANFRAAKVKGRAEIAKIKPK